MIQLIYVSTAVRKISEDDLQVILLTSILHNSEKKITGLLLYDHGTFCQVLEGEAKDVHTLFSKIQEDGRHTNIIKIFDDEILTRDFSSWSMNCINLDHYDKKQINGYRDFREAVHNWNFINPLQAKEVLMHFKTR
jgi:ribosomal protein S4E